MFIASSANMDKRGGVQVAQRTGCPKGQRPWGEFYDVPEALGKIRLVLVRSVMVMVMKIIVL